MILEKRLKWFMPIYEMTYDWRYLDVKCQSHSAYICSQFQN